MNKRLRELASAVMDVEASIEELEALSSQQVQTMMGFWRCYYQAIASVDYERRAFADWDISDRVHSQLPS